MACTGRASITSSHSKHPYINFNTFSRFPVISGMRVSWDSRKESGQRILGIWLTKEVEDSIHDGQPGYATPRLVDSEPIPRTKGGRQYKVVTREYMAQGHDGFSALQGRKYLVDDESGQPMSTVVRKYLLGKCVFSSVRQIDAIVYRFPICE